MGNLKTLSQRIVDSAQTGAADPSSLSVLTGLTASATDLNKLTSNAVTAADFTKLNGITGTAAEINKATRPATYVQTLTASGAITAASTTDVMLNHISTPIAATYAVVPNTFMVICNISASGTAAHTVTLTGGTFNGTNTVATLNTPGQALVIYFATGGRGFVVSNIGTVGLS